ncbi:MAG: carbohydrate kinase [Pseudomonadota bacterium]
MIVCCGEALIDMLPRPLAEGGDGFRPVPGGAVFNTAIGLGRLGVPAQFFSALSTDMFGELLVDALAQSDVATDLCPRKVQPTTLAFVKLVDGQATYSFFDENSAGRSLAVTDLPILERNVSALHFGAISLIPEPCGTAFETLMARNTDKVLSLDPNIRPGFIQDADAHRTRLLRMIAMADIVKVSDEDLDWLAEGAPHDVTIKHWLDGGTSIVLLTAGKDGATAYTQSGSVHQNVVAVDVVDTVGAGDTFNAGLLSSLLEQDCLTKPALKSIRDKALSAALQRAVLVAGVTVSRAGANPPWMAELDG